MDLETKGKKGTRISETWQMREALRLGEGSQGCWKKRDDMNNVIGEKKVSRKRIGIGEKE